MNKKTLLFLSISAFMLFTLSACSSNNKVSDKTIKNTPTKVVSTLPQDNEKTSEPKILYTVDTDAALKHMYLTIDEFNESSAVDAIVKGTISDVEYVYISNCAYSILTVDVSTSYKGNNSGVIKVYEDGGLVKLKDMVDSRKDNSLTADQLNNGVVDVKFFKTPHSKVGQEVMLYLTKNSTPLPTDSYRIISSLYGRFTLDKADGKYKRPALDLANDSASGSSNKTSSYEQYISKNDM